VVRETSSNQEVLGFNS